MSWRFILWVLGFHVANHIRLFLKASSFLRTFYNAFRENTAALPQNAECPKSIEPTGLTLHTFTPIHNMCSTCPPWRSTHFLSRRTMFVWILLSMLGSTSQASAIFSLTWRRSWILTAYACAFGNSYNTKSNGLCHVITVPNPLVLSSQSTDDEICRSANVVFRVRNAGDLHLGWNSSSSTI